MSVSFDSYDFGKAEFVLDAASQPVVLANIRTGTLGGLVNFRGQALGPTSDKLDELALAFGREVNKLHRQGLDSLGRPGQNLFYVGPDFTVDGRANGGSSRLGVTVINADLVDARSYEMRFDIDRGLWTLRDLKSGVSVQGTNELVLGALKFSVQGTPRDGDTYRISPESHPALTFRTLIKEGAEVASAAKMTTKSSLSNFGTSSADIRLIDPRTAESFRSLSELLPRSVPLAEQSFTANVPARKDTLVAASSQPIAVIPAGFSKVALSTSTTGGELAIFTRDGRQLSGPAMSPDVASSVVRTANGFYEGATYSDAYRNKSGDTGYLNQNFIFGVYQESGSQLDADGNRILTPAKIFGGPTDLTGFTPNDTIELQINGKTVSVVVPNPVTTEGLASAINDHKATTRAIAETTDDGKLIFKSYQEISIAAANLSDSSSITIDGVTFSVSPDQLDDEMPTPALYLRNLINNAKSGLSASVSDPDGNLIITNSEGSAGAPIVIGANNVGLAEKTYFNGAALSVGVPNTESSIVLRSLGLRSGFVMTAPLAEDLLVFGVNNQGLAAATNLSGSYEAGSSSPALAADSREYKLRFDGGRYSLVDKLTDTEVSASFFDTTSRTIRYGNWQVSLNGIPADQDEFMILPTDEPLGDNRIAAALANLQGNRKVLASGQTVQQEYENLVNRVGAITVQAEIAKDAQQVVFEHARDSRDRVSGVNLDEELADLLRFQQAYQANAQVIQVANRLFDSLLQRL